VNRVIQVRLLTSVPILGVWLTGRAAVSKTASERVQFLPPPLNTSVFDGGPFLIIEFVASSLPRSSLCCDARKGVLEPRAGIDL
jgi:hypothetical protein